MKRKIKKAVFPVAGMGTRFLPATKALPKEMLPIIDKPLIQYAVEEAYAAGIEEIIFVTGRGKSAIENHFDRSFELESILKAGQANSSLSDAINIKSGVGTITYTRQGAPLGLGHAVWCAKNIVGDEPFAILLADDIFTGGTPIMKQLVDTYEQVGGNIVAVMEVPKEQTNKYGIIEVENSKGKLTQVKGMVEKPNMENAPSNLAISGRYILQPEIFEILSKGEKGAGNEIQLTDAMVQLIGRQSFHGLLFDGKRFDCGSRLGYLHANLEFALQRTDLKDQVQEIINSYSSLPKDTKS